MEVRSVVETNPPLLVIFLKVLGHSAKMLAIPRCVSFVKTSIACKFLKRHEASICLLTDSSEIDFSDISVHRPRAAAYLPKTIDRALKAEPEI